MTYPIQSPMRLGKSRTRKCGGLSTIQSERKVRAQLAQGGRRVVLAVRADRDSEKIASIYNNIRLPPFTRFLYFPWLVLDGTHHCWTYFLIFPWAGKPTGRWGRVLAVSFLENTNLDCHWVHPGCRKIVFPPRNPKCQARRQGLDGNPKAHRSVGSLDFNFWVDLMGGSSPPKPPKRFKLFAGGSTATKQPFA